MLTISSGSYSVEVPNPELGDTQKVDVGTKLLRVMSGAIYGYKRTPVQNLYTLNLQGLTVAMVTDLVELLDARIEYPITFAWGTVSFSGIVTNKVIFTANGRVRSTTIEVQT